MLLLRFTVLHLLDVQPYSESRPTTSSIFAIDTNLSLVSRCFTQGSTFVIRLMAGTPGFAWQLRSPIFAISAGMAYY
jgi:hypothetical protein